MDIGQWLQSLDLERYEAAFRENDITVEMLPGLTAEDFKELGVASLGHRHRMLTAICKFADPNPDALQSSRPSVDQLVRPTERRHITVLFCDIVDSTPLARVLDPEDWREVLVAYQASVGAAITGQGGYVARFVGDGVLAYFGWPNADEAHAVSAVHAGLAIIEALGSRQLSVRIGIASGLVVAGELTGVGSAQSVTAVGETPNLAARLQSLAQPDTVVVSEATRLQLGYLFELEDLGGFSLKGFDAPVRAWRIRGTTGAISRSETVYAATAMPLVGRTEELNLLLHRWRQSIAGDGRTVLLAGEAGIGKSRLLAALEEQLAAECFVGLRYFCSPYHRDTPLYPIIARLEREAAFAREDSREERLRKLEAILRPAEPLQEDVGLFAALLSIPSLVDDPNPQQTPQQRKVRTAAALMRRLSNLASQQPVLLVFEDAHWADPTSIELLDAVIEQVPRLPMLLIISYRPDFIAPWFDLPNVSLMALSRLDRRDATKLAAQVVKQHVVSPPLLERIVTKSDGIPLFIEELTRAVLETSSLDALGAPLTVPDTLQASLMARLDRLPESKTIAQIGSVVGREFSHALLALLADMNEADLMSGVHRLIASGLLFHRGVPPNIVYTFKHALVRDVVYASLPKAMRQVFHLRIAEALRDNLADPIETEPAVVAYHFTEAGSSRNAVQWWSKAGTLARQRSAFVEAVAHFERALELSNDLEDSEAQRAARLRLQISVGNALRVTRGFGAPETRKAFARAREIAASITESPERFSAEYGLWSGSFLSGDLPAMRELADKLLRQVEGQSESAEWGLAHRIGGMTHWFAGDFGAAKLHLELALTAYKADRDMPLAHRFGQDVAVPILAYLAMTLWPLGRCEDAERFLEKAIAQAVRTQHVPTIAYAYLHGALFEMMRYEYVKCGSYVRVYLDLAREHNMPLWLANGISHDGWMRWRTGDRDGGTAQMHEGLRLMREQGQTVYLPLMGTRLAETEAGDGRFEMALETIDAELARIAQTGQCWFLAEVHRVRGEIILGSQVPDFESAKNSFQQAIEVARAQSAPKFETLATESLTRLPGSQKRMAATSDQNHNKE